MGAQGHVGVVRAAVGALNAGDVQGYLRAFSPSSLRWVPGVAEPFPLAAIAEDIAALRDAFTGFHLHEDLLFGDGRHVCARWRMVGTHTGGYFGIAATGREISVETCEIYEFADDGLVETTWTYGDPMALFRQISAVPEGGEAP